MSIATTKYRSPCLLLQEQFCHARRSTLLLILIPKFREKLRLAEEVLELRYLILEQQIGEFTIQVDGTKEDEEQTSLFKQV